MCFRCWRVSSKKDSNKENNEQRAKNFMKIIRIAHYSICKWIYSYFSCSTVCISPIHTFSIGTQQFRSSPHWFNCSFFSFTSLRRWNEVIMFPYGILYLMVSELEVLSSYFHTSFYLFLSQPFTLFESTYTECVVLVAVKWKCM